MHSHKNRGFYLSPSTNKPVVRAPSLRERSELANKHGVKNRYSHTHHGNHHINLTSTGDAEGLEFNTPLRNLIRVLVCGEDIDTSRMLCTGCDYAGFYQEQLTWRLLKRPVSAPIIFYASLILDWSGAKLSKSLYVKQGAYKYLCDAGCSYMLERETFLKTEGGLRALSEEFQDWVEKSYKLFKNYSFGYLDTQLTSRGMQLS